MSREPGFNRYTASGLTAALVIGVGAAAYELFHKSQFELCGSNSGQIVDSTGTWAEKTADSLACFAESQAQNLNPPAGEKTSGILNRRDHGLFSVVRRVESKAQKSGSYTGNGQGDYKITGETVGWPYGRETVVAATVQVDSGIKQLDPIYALHIFREYGKWSFDQAIIRKDRILVPVDSGMPNAEAYHTEIEQLATEVARDEQQGKPVDWITPPEG